MFQVLMKSNLYETYSYLHLFRSQRGDGFCPRDEEHVDRGSPNYPLDNINHRHHHRCSLWWIDNSVHVLA